MSLVGSGVRFSLCFFRKNTGIGRTLRANPLKEVSNNWNRDLTPDLGTCAGKFLGDLLLKVHV